MFNHTRTAVYTKHKGKNMFCVVRQNVYGR